MAKNSYELIEIHYLQIVDTVNAIKNVIVVINI